MQGVLAGDTHRPVGLVGGAGADRDRVVDDHPRRAISKVGVARCERPHGDVGRHLGPHGALGYGDEVRLHGLERGDGLAELAAFVGVVDRHLGHGAERAGGKNRAGQ